MLFMYNPSSMTSTASTAPPPATTSTSTPVWCHLTREELDYLLKAEENLPESISISDYWELYRSELEFE